MNVFYVNTLARPICGRLASQVSRVNCGMRPSTFNKYVIILLQHCNGQDLMNNRETQMQSKPPAQNARLLTHVSFIDH